MFIDKQTRLLIQTKIKIDGERQADVAMRLGITPAYLSMMLCGISPTPPDIWEGLIKDLKLSKVLKAMRVKELTEQSA